MVKRRKHSEETKNKIRESMKGKKPTKDVLKKLSESHKGHKHSEETKRKISESMKGINNPNYGKKLTQAERLNLSNKLKNKIVKKETREKISNALKGKNAPGWKGGYSSKNIPTYDFFHEKLTIEESPNRDIIDSNILTVICKFCKKRFIPRLSAVRERVRALNGTQKGEMSLYCSEKCKEKCPTYRAQPKSSTVSVNKLYTDSEYQIFRTYVLERDNYKCQYCGEKAEHVHHERPQKLEPFFALDPYYAWSVCKKCHYKYGHKDECNTWNLANKQCRGEL